MRPHGQPRGKGTPGKLFRTKAGMQVFIGNCSFSLFESQNLLRALAREGVDVPFSIPFLSRIFA
jgi:hypothetical protein